MTADPHHSEESQRWKLTISYDGRPFRGWQSQPGGNTIQDHLEAALSEITKKNRIIVHGSGRTDAGVHALGQVAHFDAPASSRLDARAWIRAANVHLPPAIRVMAAESVSQDFHARFSAKRKTYRYKIVQGDVLPPLEHGLAWHVPRMLDTEKLEAALEHFKGRHDFQNFAANRGKSISPPRTTIRTMDHVQCNPHPTGLWITITGDGFLYKMVRMLVATVIQVATEQKTLEEMLRTLSCESEQKTSHCAPPDGLYLRDVAYLVSA